MCTGRALDETVSWIDHEHRRINNELKASRRSGSDYAYAYGEMSQLAYSIATELAKCDPAFGLTPVNDAEIDAFDAALGQGRR